MPKRPKKQNQSTRNRKATKVIRGRVGPGQPAQKQRGRPRKTQTATAPIGVASSPFVHAEESNSPSRHGTPETLACHLHRMMPNEEELNQVVDTHVALVDKAVHDAVPELCPRATALIAKFAVSRVDLTNEKGTTEEFGALEYMARLFLSYFDTHKKVKEIASDYQRTCAPNRTTADILDDFRPMLCRMFLRQLDVMSDAPCAVFEVNALSHKSTPPTSLDQCEVSIEITQHILSTTIMVELYWQTCDPEQLPKESEIKLIGRVPLYSTMMNSQLSTKVFDLLADRLALPEWLSAEEFIQILVSPLDIDYKPSFNTVEAVSDDPGFDDCNLFGLRRTQPVAPPSNLSPAIDFSPPADLAPSLIAFRFVDATGPGPSAVTKTCELIQPRNAATTAISSSSNTESEMKTAPAPEPPKDYYHNEDDVEMSPVSGAEEEEAEHNEEHKGHKRLSMAGRMLKVMDEWEPAQRQFKIQQAVHKVLPLQSVAAIVAEYAFDAMDIVNHLGSDRLLDRIAQSSSEYFAYSRLIRNTSDFFGHLDLLPMLNRLYVEEVRPEYRATNYLLIAPRAEEDDRQLPQQHQQLMQEQVQQLLHPPPPVHWRLDAQPRSVRIIYTSELPPKPKKSASEDDYLNSHVVISVMYDLKRGGIPCIQVQFDPDPLHLSGRLLAEERLKRRMCRVLGRRLGVPESIDPAEWVSALTSVAPEMWQGEVAEEDETGREYEERYIEAEGSGCQLDRFRKTPRQRGHTTWIGVRNQLMYG